MNLYELALRAATTPLLEAYETGVVLQDLLLERGIVHDLEAAQKWIQREVRPTFLKEEGSWNAEIEAVEYRVGYRRGPHSVVWFRLEGSPRVFAYVVRPIDGGDVLAVLEAGRGRLTTKKLLTKDGRTFMRHTWSVR